MFGQFLQSPLAQFAEFRCPFVGVKSYVGTECIRHSLVKSQILIFRARGWLRGKFRSRIKEERCQGESEKMEKNVGCHQD